MPVIRRKLSTTQRPRVSAPIPITRKPQVSRFVPQQPTNDGQQRGMKVKAAAKYLGTSVWRVRRLMREDALPSFRLGNKDMIDRVDLDALIERLKSAA